MIPFSPAFIGQKETYAVLHNLLGPVDFLWADMDIPLMYGWFHILCLCIVSALCVFIIVKRKSISQKTVQISLLAFWIIVALFEVVKQINFSYSPTSGDWTYQWYAFPFQFCSSILYVLPLAVFVKNEKFKKFMYAFLATYNLFAGIAVMLYPSTVFIDDVCINIQTMVHHGLMVVVGVLLYATKTVDFNFKTLGKAATVFSVLVCVAFILNNTFDEKSGFNMFFIDVEGCDLPILNIISQNAPYPVFIMCYILGFTACAGIILILAKLVSTLILKCEEKFKKNKKTC